MANMMDYLLWRGDLTFREATFNEVDNLIFSELVYVDFGGIVPTIGTEETISLKEASDIFFEHHTDQEIEEKVSITKTAAFVMREMAKTKRFQNAELSNYIEEVDSGKESQFCAVTIRLDDGSMFVSYSGTDNTMIGWKENFNMTFLDHTPGQVRAVEYLNEVILPQQKKVFVGGHSKGGNLAVYASVYCKESIQKRILSVYNNDGPGFTENMMASEGYHKIQSKIHTIVPQSSIVGLFLEQESGYEVVESSRSGVLQHDPVSWEVLGGNFVYVNAVTKQSIALNKTLKAWIDKMQIEEREEFVDALFSILEEGEIRTVDDLAKVGWKKFIELMKAKNNLSQKNQKILKKTLKLLWEESNHTLRNIVIKKRK